MILDDTAKEGLGLDPGPDKPLIDPSPGPRVPPAAFFGHVLGQLPGSTPEMVFRGPDGTDVNDWSLVDFLPQFGEGRLRDVPTAIDEVDMLKARFGEFHNTDVVNENGTASEAHD